MTISTTTSRAQYAGNGVTTIFSFPYRFLANGDLEVTLFDAAGTPDPQTLTTDYTVLGADNDAGGSVTMLVAPAVGETLVIRRVVALTQETDYISGDSFPAETHERALDRLTMADQQLQEQVDRSITLPLDDETFSGALPAIVASRFLRVNDTGTAFELVEVVDVGELVVSPFIETLLDDANAAAARTTLGAAKSGANSDITSLTGLTTPLSIAQGGTAAITAAAARASLGTGDGANLTDNTVTPAKLTQKFTVGAAIPTTSGTSIDITGVFPSWARHIRLGFVGNSTNGTDALRIQLGDAGGIENSGYSSGGVIASSGTAAATTPATAGFDTGGPAANTFTVHGIVEFISADGLTWACVGSLANPPDGRFYSFAGSKTLSAALDRIRVTTTGGTNTFDVGSIIPSWQ